MRRFTAINYYALLGVTSEATRDEIRSAYRVKVRAAHPDHGGDPELFAQIAEAWEVLGSESERTIYDADRKLRMRSARPYSTRLPRDHAPPRDSNFAPKPDAAEGDGAVGDEAEDKAEDESPKVPSDRFNDRKQWMQNKRRL